MKLKSNTYFLIDGLGALCSTFMLGVILTKFEAVFGMAKNVLYYLAITAGVFAIYSFTCYLKSPKNWRAYLKAIAFANLIYSCVTIGLIIYFQSELKVVGFIYFIGELIVLFCLIGVELKIAFKR